MSNTFRRLAVMIQNSKRPLAQVAFRFALFCAWFAFVTVLTTTGCMVLFQWLLQNRQVTALIQGDSIWRPVFVYGIVVIWMVLQVNLAFLLPIRILKRRERVKQYAV